MPKLMIVRLPVVAPWYGPRNVAAELLREQTRNC
jgi:hypothetical protein